MCLDKTMRKGVEITAIGRSFVQWNAGSSSTLVDRLFLSPDTENFVMKERWTINDYKMVMK